MKHIFSIAAAIIIFSAQSAPPAIVAIRAARLIDGRGGAAIAPAVRTER